MYQSLMHYSSLKPGMEVRGEPPLWLEHVQEAHIDGEPENVECGTVTNRTSW